MSKMKTERNRLIVKLKKQGWSFRKIANEFGLKTKSRIHEIYHREINRKMNI